MALSAMESLLLQAEELAQMGSWEVDLETREALYSDGLYRILGEAPRATALGVEMIVDRAHPDDRDELRALLRLVREDPDAIPADGVTREYRWMRSDGALRDVRLHGHIEPAGEGHSRRWLGVVQDVTEQRLTERELQARYAVTQALREWGSFEEGLVTLVRKLGTALEYPIGGLWVWDADERMLVPRASWCAPSVDAGEFERAVRTVSLGPGQGITGAAWATGEPVFVPDDPSRFRTREARRMGVRSGLAVPVIADSESIAVLTYYDFEPRAAGASLMSTFTGIGRELGLFLARRRADLGPKPLSERELEVLQLAADGLTGPQIAERLFLSPTTVKTHFEHIYEKLGVGDRAAAVAHALRTGLIH